MNKVALITGASRGIGKALADYFARQSHDLILVARDRNALEDVADSLRHKHGVAVSVIDVDICAFDEVDQRVQKQLTEHGRLDVLVNAAGIFRFGTSALNMDDLQAMLATNVMAVHNLCTSCGDALKAAGEAHVFNVSSIVGVEGYAPVGGYAASKFAQLGYGQSLGKELLDEGIKVTTLCPDVVNTDMGAGSGLSPDQMISTRDIARAIDFVMSLSPAAHVDRIVMKCLTLEALMNVRK